VLELVLQPGVDPEYAALQVVHGEAVGPAAAARLLVDGFPALAAHGGRLDARQAGVPVGPEQDPGGVGSLKGLAAHLKLLVLKELAHFSLPLRHSPSML